jgi:hypothetical protein
MRKTATRPAAVLASLRLLGMALTTQPASAGPAAPVAVAGVAAGNGALVTYGTTTAFVPRAFNSVGAVFPVEYASDGDTTDVVECSPNLSAADLAKLAAARDTMEHHTGAQIGIMKEKWAVNAVRFQVSQGALLKESMNGGANPYTDAVLGIVSRALAQDVIVVVSMQTQAYSCTKGSPHLPNADTLAAWRQLTPTWSTRTTTLRTRPRAAASPVPPRPNRSSCARPADPDRPGARVP